MQQINIDARGAQKVMGRKALVRLLLNALLMQTQVVISPEYVMQTPAPSSTLAPRKPSKPAKRRDTKRKAKPRKKQQLGRRDTRRRCNG